MRHLIHELARQFDEKTGPYVTLEMHLESALEPLREAVANIIDAADAKDQPMTSANIPRVLIERLREAVQ